MIGRLGVLLMPSSPGFTAYTVFSFLYLLYDYKVYLFYKPVDSISRIDPKHRRLQNQDHVECLLVLRHF